jgi:hypothetical protein
MIKRGLTLDNAMNITSRISIYDYSGPRADCTTARVTTPVLNEGTGACRRQAWPTCTWTKSELPPGQALRQPAPLFEKLDESVIEEEYARLGG